MARPSIRYGRQACATALAMVLVMASALLWAPSALAADVPSVIMRADRSVMTVDDQLVLTVTYRGSFDEGREPGFSGLQAVSRSEAKQFKITNGVVDRSRTLTIRLQARRPGTFTITGAQVIVGGAVVGAANNLTVQVTEAKVVAATSAAGARDLKSRLSEPYFLHVEPKRSRYYVGEPFVLEWKFYFNPRANVESASVTRQPTLKGLLADPIQSDERRPAVKNIRIGGTRMRMLQRSAKVVTGLAPGTVIVDAMQLQVVAGDVFNRRAKTIQSRPFKLEIAELPDKDRPPGMASGAIGRFAMNAGITGAGGARPTKIATGERLVLEVTIAGQGNLVGLKPPAVEGGGHFDIQNLPGGSMDEVLSDITGVHGRRVFQYLVSALEPGDVTTPTVVFSFFDPQTETYKTLRSPGSPVTVIGRAKSAQGEAAAYEGGDIGPLMESVNLGDTGRAPLVRSLFFWILFLLPGLGWLAVEFRHRAKFVARRDKGKVRSKSAASNAQKRLSVAEKAMAEGLVGDFYGHVSRALVTFFEERGALAATGMTHDALRAAAVARGVSEDLMGRVIVELENADFARFAPSSDAQGDMAAALARVRTLVGDLDKGTLAAEAS